MKYPYLEDKNFLKELDKETYRKQFIRITVLNFSTEEPITSIEGKSTGGSCNLSGTSNMRRTANCSLVVDPNGLKIFGASTPRQYNNITNVNNIISINKKIRLEVGLKNYLSKYTEYDIIWFPLGTYVIKAASITTNNSGTNISLTLNDKTALINGDMGGIFPATTVLSEIEYINANGESYETKKILIKDIIRDLIVNYGGERGDNIIISDIPETAVKVVRWIGTRPLYLIEDKSKKHLTMDVPQKGVGKYRMFKYGDDIGYINEPFVYPGTLEAEAGETVASILDKIKNTLGNFEWGYDIDGHFFFRQIKNYLNISKATELLDISAKDYLAIPNDIKTAYIFDDTNAHLLSSISSNPQYSNIKNDFVIWGSKKIAANTARPIRYHLAFDNKPTQAEINKDYLAIVYQDSYDIQRTVILKENDNYEKIDSLSTIVSKDREKYYLLRVKEEETTKITIYHWDDIEQDFLSIPNATLCYVKAGDWRTALYLKSLNENEKTFSQNYYAAELKAEWPKICEMMPAKQEEEEEETRDFSWNPFIKFTLPLYTSKYRHELESTDIGYKKKEDYDYWLDFLSEDPNVSLSQFSVGNIGRRTKVDNKNNSNCLFPYQIPNYIYICADGDTDVDLEMAEKNPSQQVIQVKPEIFNKFGTGGTRNSAFEKLQELLQTYTQYNESINISTVPIFHLEPNTRITLDKNFVGANGDYLIKTISLPLAVGGMATISATRCIEKERAANA